MTFIKAFKRGLIIGSLGLAATAFAGVSPFSTNSLNGCWNAVADGQVPYVGGGGNNPQTRHTVIAGMTLDDGTITGGEVVQQIDMPNQSQLGGEMTCFFTLSSGSYSVDGDGLMTVSANFTPNPGQLPGCNTPQTTFTGSIAIDSFKHGRGTYHNQIKANGQSDQGGTVEIYKQVEAE